MLGYIFYLYVLPETLIAGAHFSVCMPEITSAHFTCLMPNTCRLFQMFDARLPVYPFTHFLFTCPSALLSPLHACHPVCLCVFYLASIDGKHHAKKGYHTPFKIWPWLLIAIPLHSSWSMFTIIVLDGMTTSSWIEGGKVELKSQTKI